MVTVDERRHDAVDDVDLDFLRDSARDYLAGRGEKIALADLAGMDWTGLLVDEALGGVGWRPVEATVMAEELGRAGDRSVWLGSTICAAALASAPTEIRDRWLADVLAGTAPAAVASGGATVRVAASETLRLMVTLGNDGVRFFEVTDTLPRSRDDDMLEVRRPVWRVDLSAAPSVMIGGRERAGQLLAIARVLLSADSLGASSRTLERLVEYLKERSAFGAPIASFQAVQHRLVDLLVVEAKSRAVIVKAARALAAPESGEEAIALSVAAHAYVGSTVTAAIDECMQLSGGIGFTWEYPLHHDLRRVFTNGHLLGTTRSSTFEYAMRAGW